MLSSLITSQECNPLDIAYLQTHIAGVVQLYKYLYRELNAQAQSLVYNTQSI